MPRSTAGRAAMLALAPLAAGEASAQVARVERQLTEMTSVRFYGHINQGVLYHDDGDDSNTFAPVDNSNSSTRAGIRSDSDFGNGWSLLARIEAEYQPRPSDAVSQRDTEATDWNFDRQNMRKFELNLANDRFGTLWLGQGSMATDGIAEIDLSGTDVIAYSSVADTAGGQFFRFSNVPDDPTTAEDESLSEVAIGDTFANYDGSRRMRVLYESPSFSGFGVALAYGQEVLRDGDDNDYYDVALTYGNEFDTVEAEAGVGYSWLGDDEIIVGSGSLLHTPTGLNVTLAAGQRDFDAGGEGSYYYLKLGLLRDFIDIGATALSIDYIDSDEVNGPGTSGESYSFAAVQNVDRYNLELYGTVRNHSYEDDGPEGYEDGLAFFAGVRFTW